MAKPKARDGRSRSRKGARRRSREASPPRRKEPAIPPAEGVTRPFLVVFGITTLAYMVLMAGQRLYPLIDLPFHLAAGTIFRYIDDPTTGFRNFFALDVFPKPNIFHLVFTGTFLPSVEAANRLLITLYTAAIPLLVFLILRRIGGNVWLSLLSFLVLFNFSFEWGFVGFFLSIPVVLLFLFQLLRYNADPGWKSGGILALIGILLYFFHVLAAMFCLFVLGLTFLFDLSRSRSAVRSLAYLAPTVPVLVLILLWWTGDHSQASGRTAAFIGDYYRTDYLSDFSSRLHAYRLDNRQLFDKEMGLWAGAAFYGVILIVAVWGLVRQRWWWRVAGRRWTPVTAYALTALLCYWFLPNRLPGQFFLYERFWVHVFLALILLSGIVFRGGVPWAGRIAVLAVVLVHLGLYGDYYRDFQKDASDFTEDLFPEPGPTQILGGMVYTPRFRGQPVYGHFPCYHIVWKHGIATTRLVDFRFTRVSRKVDRRSYPPFHDRVETTPYDGRYTYCDYIVVRGEIPEEARKLIPHFQPVLRSTAPGSTWTLYKNMGLETLQGGGG